MRETVGIYCLANDKVLDQTIAFLESLRAHEPQIPLMVIPFDDNTEKLSELAATYRFSFFHHQSLETLDRVGAPFVPNGSARARLFRKFAVFWGPFDHFLFLDIDIVVLDTLGELLSSYLSSKCDFVCFDNAIDQVYKPTALRTKMITEYAARGFNTGAFLSSQGVLTLDEVEATASKAVAVKDSFVATTGEQPFFNYCMDTKRAHIVEAAELMPDLSASAWAPLRLSRKADGSYRVCDTKSPFHNKRLLFVHWAGFSCDPYMPNRRLFTRYRVRGYTAPLSRIRYLFAFYILRLCTPANVLRWLYRQWLQRTR